MIKHAFILASFMLSLLLLGGCMAEDTEREPELTIRFVPESTKYSKETGDNVNVTASFYAEKKIASIRVTKTVGGSEILLDELIKSTDFDDDKEHSLPYTYEVVEPAGTTLDLNFILTDELGNFKRESIEIEVF